MQIGLSQLPFSRFRRLSAWSGLVIVALSIFMGVLTFSVLTGLLPIKPTRETILWLMGLNVGLVAIMALMVLWQVWHLFAARRHGEAGASLHFRLVSLFSLIAALPVLIVAAFAAVTLNRGLDTWFSERTRAIVDTSVTVAEAYLRDHSEATRGDVAAISADLNQQRELFDSDRQAFVTRVAKQAVLRGLAGAFVFDIAQKRIEVNVTASEKLQFRAPAEEDVKKADAGELVVLAPNPGGNVIRALIKLTAYPSHYLYVYRLVNPSVLEQLEKTRAGKAEYDQLMEQRVGVQVTFALMYAGVSLIFLLAAIWLGLWYADRLVAPVVKLLYAARRVSGGDLGAKVEVGDDPGDLATLGHTFNSMTEQLKGQRDALVSANYSLDERRQFTEAVLSGVSAGVLGVEADGRISLANRQALGLFGYTEAGLIGRPLEDTFKAFVPVFEQAIARQSGMADAQVNVVIAGRERSLIVRVTSEESDGAERGRVVTFDDITELVSAQRNSAWADIARRIAHEIKNPLTPIQLSAERLKRKYAKEIQTDKAVFEQCTDTIIRQVGDIGRMVDEFSSFARMPSAVLEMQDLTNVVREATVLQRVSAGDLQIDVNLPENPVLFAFDRRLVTQAVTNLVKNAREAIESRQNGALQPVGQIVVDAGLDGDRPFIRVTDNGVGLPKENRHRLTEPYMTTRAKGTGLGLAIVKRIMEEHKGSLTLEDAPQTQFDGLGARVELIFPAIVFEPLAATA